MNYKDIKWPDPKLAPTGVSIDLGCNQKGFFNTGISWNVSGYLYIILCLFRVRTHMRKGVENPACYGNVMEKANVKFTVMEKSRNVTYSHSICIVLQPWSILFSIPRLAANRIDLSKNALELMVSIKNFQNFLHLLPLYFRAFQYNDWWTFGFDVLNTKLHERFLLNAPDFNI